VANTISAAIAQAVLDGASAANQINIYVKPDLYVESLTLSDGINIVGFPDSGSSQLQVSGGMAVKLQGVIDFSGGLSRVENIQVIPTGSSPFVCSGNCESYLTNIVYLETVNPATILNITGTIVQLFLKGCYFSSATGALLADTSLTGNLTVNDCSLASGAVSFPASTASRNILVNNATVAASFDSTAAGSFTLKCTYSNIQAIGVNPILTSTDPGHSFIATQCQITATGAFSQTANSVLRDCFCSTFVAGTATLTQMVNCATFSNPDRALSTGTEIFRNRFSSAFSGSYFVRDQAFLTTANATTTNIASIVLNEEEAITVTGTVIGSNTAHTDTTGGTFTIVARRTTAGNITQVSITTADVKADTLASFTADVDIGTQTVRIRVTGLLATTYNWACTFEYQKMLLAT
jgi:hypothetical protein